MSFLPARIKHLKPVIVLYFLFQIFLFSPRLNSDGAYYYEYVRSLVLQNDLNFDDERVFFTWEWVPVLPRGAPGDWKDTGHPPNIFSFGPAMVWLPIYLGTHLIISFVHRFSELFSSNGYGLAYRLPVMCISLLAGWFTLILLDMLGEWIGFEKKIRTWALFFLLGASHFPAFLFVTPAFSHALSAFASVLFFIAWYRSRDGFWDWKGYTLFGMLSGIMVVLRWQNAFSLILPFCDALVAVFMSPDLSTAFRRLRKWIAFSIAFLFCLVPQLIVTYIIYGHPITDPQGKGGMHWLDPQWRLVLFDGLKGLFSVNPILLISLVGIIFLIPKHHYRLAWGIFLMFGIQLYVNAVRRDWAGVGFGMRRFLNLLPVFSVGLMAVLDHFSRYRLKKILFGFFLVFGIILIVWNILLMSQYYYSELGAPWTTMPVYQMLEAQFTTAPQCLVKLVGSSLIGRGIESENLVMLFAGIAVCIFMLLLFRISDNLKEKLGCLWKSNRFVMIFAIFTWIAVVDLWLCVSIYREADYDVVQWNSPKKTPLLRHLRLNRISGYLGTTSEFLCTKNKGYFLRKAKPTYIRDQFLSLGRLKWLMKPVASPEIGFTIPVVSSVFYKEIVVLTRWESEKFNQKTLVGRIHLEAVTKDGSNRDRYFDIYADPADPDILVSEEGEREILTFSYPAINRLPPYKINRFRWILDQPIQIDNISLEVIASGGIWHISGIGLIREKAS